MSQVLDSIRATGTATKEKGMDLLDSQIPPERRSELSQSIQSWAKGNPKLAGFLAAHILCSSIPLLLFLLFVTTTFATALTTLLVLALVSALAFTALAAGAALLVLVPTLCITSLVATLLFIWGLAGYLVLQWRNGGDPPALYVPSRREVGDKVNEVTDGRFELWLADKEQRKAALQAVRKERGELGGPGGGLVKAEDNHI